MSSIGRRPIYPHAGQSARHAPASAKRPHPVARRARHTARSDYILGSCRPPGAARSGRVLGCRWHAGDHGGVDGRHRHLFRLSRGRAHAADRPAGRDAVRLRRPRRRIARARSTASPAVRCWTRSNSSRSSISWSAARRRWSSALQHDVDRAIRDHRLDQDAAARPPVEYRSAAPKPSPISDKVIFTSPPDREARLELRTPANRAT